MIVTALTIGFVGNILRCGSSTPYPFCMSTIVVLAGVTTGAMVRLSSTMSGSALVVTMT
jgi:hypothetical protein